MSDGGCEFVYLGLVIPGSGFPQREVMVAKVFADKEKALDWRLEMPPSERNRPYRTVKKYEVER